MTPISPTSTFSFNGVDLTPGDHISFIATDVPLPHVEAAFVQVDEDGNMEVFSTLLAPFQHGGMFKPSDVLNIQVVRKADEAFSLEARNPTLRRGFQAECVIKSGAKVSGTLLAAFDGIVTMWCPETNSQCSGGSSFFKPLN